MTYLSLSVNFARSGGRFLAALALLIALLVVPVSLARPQHAFAQTPPPSSEVVLSGVAGRLLLPVVSPDGSWRAVAEAVPGYNGEVQGHQSGWVAAVWRSADGVSWERVVLPSSWPAGNQRYSVAVDDDGSLLMSSNRTVFAYRAGQWSTSALPVPTNLKDPSMVSTGDVWGEFGTMSSSGRVVEGGGGRTFVAEPPSPASYPSAKPGSVYAEFDVPTESLWPAGQSDWSVIPGPNVSTTRFGPPPPEMPPATNICLVCRK